MIICKSYFEEAYSDLIKKSQKKIFTSMAFRDQAEQLRDPKLHSLLSVGADGMTTMHFELNPDMHFNEMNRLINQFEQDSIIPKINFKKFQVIERITSPTKTRKIIKPCLRDQVILRAVLKKLSEMNIVSGHYNPYVKVIDLVTDIHNNLMERNAPYTIIRTDIQNFYPSVNVDLLLQHFLENCCKTEQEKGIYHIIRKALRDNKTAHEYTGLPIGMSLSTLLGEYYFSMMGLHDLEPGVKLFRFADDCVFVLDENINAHEFLLRFHKKIESYNLKCGAEKTFILQNGTPFDFLGIHFENGQVSIDPERKKNWEKRVKKDIAKEFQYYKLQNAVFTDCIPPSNKSIVKNVLKQHYSGRRSRMGLHQLKIEALNNHTRLNPPTDQKE